MSNDQDNDPWRIGHAARKAKAGGAAEADLRYRRLDAGPLEERTGPCVPDALMPLLFADDGTNCLAVLDAGMIEDLPAMLAESGLEHMCLFRDEALDSLRDVAPWLVRLTPDATLTRRIFTKGRARWDLWGRGAGILLRTPAMLAETGSHLRRFIRVATSDNKTLFLKFWHEAVLNAFCAASSPDPLALEFLSATDVVYLATTGLSGPELRHVAMVRGVAA